jgi:hypothetical protein
MMDRDRVLGTFGVKIGNPCRRRAESHRREVLRVTAEEQRRPAALTSQRRIAASAIKNFPSMRSKVTAPGLVSSDSVMLPLPSAQMYERVTRSGSPPSGARR